MTYARRTDANSADIVRRLREMGVQIFDMSRAAKWNPGFPDLLVILAGQMHLVEVKSAKGTFTEDQKRFHMLWNGPPIYTMRCESDAEHFVNHMRARAFRGTE